MMGIGKIASFLSSLSPAADATAAEQIPEEAARHADGPSEQPGLAGDGPHGDPSEIVAQLQTIVGAVRTLNDNAVEQGAAVAVSPAGTLLRNALTALGHLLAAVDSQDLAHGAAAPVREAASVVEAVDAGLAGTRAAAEQVMRNLSAPQAQRARDASDRFQADMRTAIAQVRRALGGLTPPPA